MGKEILYCHQCGRQLSADDFTRGRAHTFDNRQYCMSCVPSTQTSLPASPPTPAPRTTKRQATTLHLVAQRESSLSTSRSALIVSLVVAGVVVVLLLVLFLNPSAPAVPPREPAPPPRGVESRKPAEEPGKKEVEQAREFSSGNPHALDEQVRLWEKAVAASAKTPHADEALKGLERAIAQRKEEFAQELKALEPKIAERMKMEQFGVAVDLMEEAKKRHESPEWMTAVAGRIKELQEAADKLYPELKARALGAQAKGDSAKVVEQRSRLTVWGRRDLLADLESELAKVVPREELPKGAVPLLRFPNDGSRKYRLVGSLRDGSLLIPRWNDHSVLGGFESITESVAVPTDGEIWLTYSTTSPAPMVIRFRVARGNTTIAHDWKLTKPEVGRPVCVKAPIPKFRDFNNKPIIPGERFTMLYISQEDGKPDLVIHELLMFRTQE